MTDLEARLRGVLREELDPVTADTTRVATTATRARRARVLRAGLATVAAAAVTLAGIGTVAALTRDRAPLPPSGTEGPRATFAVDLGEGRSALVAIDREQGQVCYGTDYLPIASAVTLRREEGALDPVVTTFTSSPGGYAERLCGRVGRVAAGDVLASPETHYLRFDVAAATISGTLGPYDPPPGRIPHEADVVCGPAGATALVPEVRPQNDGVHLNVYNFGGRGGEVSVVGPGTGGFYDLPPDGLTRTTIYFPPGPVQIGCTRGDDLVAYHGPGSERFAHLEIVDRYGLWTDPALECGDPQRRRAIPTAVTAGGYSGILPRFSTLVRELVPGVQPGDVVERPGYPDAPAKIETRTIVRDGARIARVWLSRKGGAWALVPWACPGSGIAERDA